MFTGKNGCNIALDFDNTVCRDPIMWSNVVDIFQQFRHNVMIVTGRCADWENHDIEQFAKKHNLYIHYCECGSKRDYMLNVANIVIDIWIDDLPESVLADWNHEKQEVTHCYICEP